MDLLNIAFASVILWLFAALLALVETHVEGNIGWARGLKHTFRISPGKHWLASFWGIIFRGRELTGYHLALFPMVVVIFHFPFILTEWTLQKEALMISLWFITFALWDFLYFVLNPNFGLKTYLNKSIDHFKKSRWFLGILEDYWWAILGAILVSYFGGVLNDFISIIVGLSALTVLTLIVAPAYHRWHKKMMERTEPHQEN